MPLTVLTTLFGSIVLFSSWALIGVRMRNLELAASRQMKLLHNFFFYIAVFFLLMFLPHLWLSIDAAKFPFYMALGYTIGHVFLYVSLTYMARLFCSLSPRLASKERVAAAICVLLNVAITVLTAATMLFGVRPAYDAVHRVTLFHANPVVGVSIALFSASVIAPTAVLMIVNGIRNARSRVRSFLLGGGLLILFLGGPVHDTARTAMLYMIADSVTTFGLLVIAAGVLYRFEERLVPARRPVRRRRVAAHA